MRQEHKQSSCREGSADPTPNLCQHLSPPTAAILDDPMECSRGERLSITLAKNRINRAPERVGKARVEVDIFELLRDSEYETAETSEYTQRAQLCSH